MTGLRPSGIRDATLPGFLSPGVAKVLVESFGIEEKYCVSPLEFSAHGGCFPVCIKGSGLVGTVTVSGLPQADDHALVVECIREFLDKG